MPQWTIIAVTQSWPLPKGKDAWIDDSPPPVNYRPEPLLQTRARFDVRRDGSLISAKLARKLLGSHDQVAYIGIRYYHVVEHTVRMRRLQIVQGLECDVVLNGHCFPHTAAGFLPQQYTNRLGISCQELPGEPDCEVDHRQATECCGSERQTSTSGTQLETAKDQPQVYAYHVQGLLEIAASNGYLVMDYPSLDAFASLLDFSRPTSRDGSIQRYTGSSNTAYWSPDLDFGSVGTSSTQSIVSTSSASTSAHMEWDQESSTYTAHSQDTMCTSFPRVTRPCCKPGYRNWLTHGTQDLGYGLNSTATIPGTMASLGNGELSTGSEASICDLSEVHSDRYDCSFKTQEAETQGINHPLNDFESHPGHKVWEWDITRQQWHKKGGTTEADWFPDDIV